LPSFGEKLKQEREKRKITLEQISSSTKIGTRMLQALEEDKFNQLPGGIFNKGFVRAYARVVGLDEDQTVADYLEASGDAPPVSTEIAPREDGARENAEHVRRLEASNDDSARPLPWGLFAALLLVVALALSLWSYRQRERASQSAQPTPTTAATQLPATPFSGEVPGGAPDKEPSNNIGPGSPNSASPTTASPTARSTSTPNPSQSHRLTPQDSAASTIATPGEFTLLIHAREESWISITADGRTVSSELLPAGGERTVRGRKEITVKAGNAGGVDFRFNGKKLDFGGEFGEVKTVTFGPRGMLSVTPSPVATP
jgi:cytoskeleton protein RodZ